MGSVGGILFFWPHFTPVFVFWPIFAWKIIRSEGDPSSKLPTPATSAWRGMLGGNGRPVGSPRRWRGGSAVGLPWFKGKKMMINRVWSLCSYFMRRQNWSCWAQKMKCAVFFFIYIDIHRYFFPAYLPVCKHAYIHTCIHMYSQHTAYTHNYTFKIPFPWTQ